MKKIPVWKNLILIVSVIVMIIIATVAWFFTGPHGTVEGIEVKVGQACYIQVSGSEGDEWSEDMEVLIGIYDTMKEISGNGAKFFRPNYDIVEVEEFVMDENGEPARDEKDNLIKTVHYEPAIVSFREIVPYDTSSSFYYEETLRFRSNIPQEVYLTNESYVKALDGTCIDGAIRVAFYEVDGDTETLKYIWAPNSKIDVNAPIDEGTEDGTEETSEESTQEGTETYVDEGVEDYYYYQRSAKVTDPYDLSETTSDIVVIPTNNEESGYVCDERNNVRFVWSNGELPLNTPALLYLPGEDSAEEEGSDVTATNEDEELRFKTLKVRIWIEGHDRECTSEINGARFEMKLHFTVPEENNDE